MSFLFQVESGETSGTKEKNEEVVTHVVSNEEKKEDIVSEKVVPKLKKMHNIVGRKRLQMTQFSFLDVPLKIMRFLKRIIASTLFSLFMFSL